MNGSSVVDRSQRDRKHRAQRGVTLIEAVLSLAILGIIMASIGAATSVLMRLMPRTDDPRTVAIAASSLLERFDADVAAAITVLRDEPDALELLVAGLGEDNAPATVMYEYDGDQSAILRAVDGETSKPVIAGINDAQFGYTKIQRASAEEVEPKSVETEFGTETISCTSLWVPVESNRALRQRITPVLDEDASIWTIQSISLRLKQHVLFGGGTCRISFHYINDDATVNPTPFAQRNISISSLPSSSAAAEWASYEFEDMPWIDRERSIAVLVTAVGGSFRSHMAIGGGFTTVEFVNVTTGSATPIPGFLLCFELSGTEMVPSEQPAPIELVESITLLIEHPTLAEPFLHEAKSPVPILSQP